MKKKIIVKDLVAENRKLQDTFKKRLNEGFFDNVLKKVGMGAPEEVKQKKVSTMTPKEKELYDKAKAAAGTAAEDAAWAAYEAERYSGEDKSPILGKQETPIAQELQKKTVEDMVKEAGMDSSKVTINFDGTLNYDGQVNPRELSKHVDDKGNALLPIKKCSSVIFGSTGNKNPFETYEKVLPQECGKVEIYGGKNGDSTWMEKYENKRGVTEYVKSKIKGVTDVQIKYVFDYQMDKDADYDTEMRR